MTKLNKNVFLHANGMPKSVCKNWCKFIFQDFFHSIEINREDRCFDIFLKDQVVDLEGKVEKVNEQFDIPYFKEYWGKPFRVMIIKAEKA